MAQLDLAALVGGRPLAGLVGLGEHRGELAGVEVALVEQHLRLPRDGGHDARLAGRAAGRADAALVPHADLADRQRGLGGGEEGVLPQVHRGGAGVGRAPGEDRDAALDPERPEHGRGRLLLALEHRALLDVQLEVRARPLQLRARLVHLGEVDVVAGDDVLEPLAVAVLEVADLVDVERPRAGGRAEQAAPEARALLVGPVDEAQPHGPFLLRVRAQRLERGEDPERAVEPAARRHGVDVRAHDHEPLLLAGEVGPHVPGRVGLDLDGQLLELASARARAP